MLHIAMVGFGAIAHEVLRCVAQDSRFTIDAVVVPQNTVAEVALRLKDHPSIQVVSKLEGRPDLIVECAGHAALKEHVLPALRQGIDAIVVSIGALAEQNMAEAIEQAAREGGATVQLLSGAIGAIDALAAAKLAGLDEVVYAGRKPALAWLGTPAEQAFDLSGLTEAIEIFSGTARDAARLYPKNANVAATLALAGLGFEDTRVRLIADPTISENIHHVEARGAFGQFELTMQGKPLANNPKTSALTVYSVVRALMNHVQPLSI